MNITWPKRTFFVINFSCWYSFTSFPTLDVYFHENLSWFWIQWVASYFILTEMKLSVVHIVVLRQKHMFEGKCWKRENIYVWNICEIYIWYIICLRLNVGKPGERECHCQHCRQQQVLQRHPIKTKFYWRFFTTGSFHDLPESRVKYNFCRLLELLLFTPIRTGKETTPFISGKAFPSWEFAVVYQFLQQTTSKQLPHILKFLVNDL